MKIKCILYSSTGSQPFLDDQRVIQRRHTVFAEQAVVEYFGHDQIDLAEVARAHLARLFVDELDERCRCVVTGRPWHVQEIHGRKKLAGNAEEELAPLARIYL